MRLLRLRASHLFSLGEVDINLENRGLVLITGHSKDEGGNNGAGKSSLANKAILWTLFGETAGGTRADAVGNRYFAKGCFGEVHFTGIDGGIYRVYRGRPATISLHRGDVEVSGKTAKDTQEQINLVLGCDFRTFIQTSFFGQGRALSYASLTPKDQKAVLESILPMEEVDRWAKYADECYKKTQLQEAQILHEASLQRQVHFTLNGEKQRAAERGAEFEVKRQKYIQDSEDLIQRVKIKYLTERASLKSEIGLLEQTDMDTAPLTEERFKLESIANEADKKYKEAAVTQAQWDTRRQYLCDERLKLEKSTACPTCLREFDASTVNSVRDRMKQHDALIDEASTNVKLSQTAKAFYDNQKRTAERDINSNSTKINHMNEMAAAQNALVLRLTILDLTEQKEIEQTKQSIEMRTKEENPHVAAMIDIERRAATAEDLMNRLHSQGQVFIDERKHLEYWKLIYGKELKLKMFEEVCSYLDARVAYHLKRLGNAQIHVLFSTVKRLANGDTKEDFNVYVESTTGGKGFDSLSGGEQQMVSFSIGLGLADLASRGASGKFGLLILDEPFTELDARNSESIVTYLRDEVDKGRDTILLISNDESLKGLVGNRIHVVKEKGITSVAEG